MNEDLKVYTVIDVARVMKVDQHLARSWFRTGALKGIRLGGRAGWRCTEEQLRQFIEVESKRQDTLFTPESNRNLPEQN